MTFIPFIVIIDLENFIYMGITMSEEEKNPGLRTEVPKTSTQTGTPETAQSSETQETTKTPEQEAAEQAETKATAEDLAEQEKKIKEAHLVQQTKTEVQEVVTEDQKAQEVSKSLEKLSKTIKPDEEGNIFLTAEQLHELDRIDNLLTSPQTLVSLPPIPRTFEDYLTREDLLDPASIKAARKRIENRLKAEKKSRKELDKFLVSYEKLLNEQNHNNYLLQRL